MEHLDSKAKAWHDVQATTKPNGSGDVARDHM
jgi:hypothetical protein